MAVASAGPYASSLQTDNHTSNPPLSFLQAGCPSCCPTNSVKALKGERLKEHIKYNYTKERRQICTFDSPLKGCTLKSTVHRRSFRGWGKSGGFAPKPRTIFFFQNGISIWHLIYTVIHNCLKIYCLRYPPGMLEDRIH